MIDYTTPAARAAQMAAFLRDQGEDPDLYRRGLTIGDLGKVVDRFRAEGREDCPVFLYLDGAQTLVDDEIGADDWALTAIDGSGDEGQVLLSARPQSTLEDWRDGSN